MQSTLIWLSSRACQQSIAVAELQKLPLHGPWREFLVWDPHRRNKSKSPRTCGSVSPAGGRGSADRRVSTSSPAPVPASRLLLPVDPDLP